jgi:hypothetical protein
MNDHDTQITIHNKENYSCKYVHVMLLSLEIYIFSTDLTKAEIH